MRIIKFFFPILIFLAGAAIISFVAVGQLADKALPAMPDPDTSHYSAPAPRFFLYKPDANVKVEEGRFKAGLLFDVENRRIVWQKDMSSIYPIASLTKMMVALMAVEDVHAGKIHWDDQVQWTREYVVWNKRKCSKSYAQVSYKLYDLFKNAMIASNNEAAEQMARYVGNGDLDAAIQRMNVRARELGMNSTYYGNPTGLPARASVYDNSSTPSDLLLLTIEMLKHPEITEVTGMDYAAINNGKSTSVISNHNHLAIDYKGQVDGMKTGYTRRAGFCLVATSNKCDHRLISIVLGARAPITRNEIVKNMFNDYYASIGSDPLAPHCVNPQVYSTTASADEDANQAEGEYGYQTKMVFKPYIVHRGEHISTIANKFSCTTADLRNWNHLRRSALHAGQKLVVRTTVKEKVWITKQEEPSPNQNITVDNNTGASNAVSLSDNSVKKGTKIKLVKPVMAVTVSKPADENINKESYTYHTVQRGDTLFKIAQRYRGTSVKKLKELNNLSDASSIKPGMKIKIPSGG